MRKTIIFGFILLFISASVALAQYTQTFPYLGKRATEPATCLESQVYYNLTLSTYRFCSTGNTWTNLTAPPTNVVVSSNSSTITISGNGTTATPLSANLKLSTANNQLLQVVDDGLYATNPATIDYALRFDASKAHHVDHGVYWNRAAAAPGSFFYEAIVRFQATATSGAYYIISDGYGGAHNLLFGANGCSPRCTITGNVYIGGSLVSFNSIDSFAANEWHIIAVGWDGTTIRTYLDGVQSGATSASGTRQTTGNASEGIMFVGGSDHNNWNGDILRIRGFEGQIPITSYTYTPQRVFLNSFVDFANANLVYSPSFLVDYTRPQTVIPDLSKGYQGTTHVGVLRSGQSTGGFNDTVGKFGNGYTPDATLPQWIPANFSTSFQGTTPSIPSGAIVYDSFERKNVTGWETGIYATLGLGTAQTGQTWTGSSANQCGIIDGSVYIASPGTAPCQAGMDTLTANQDVKVTRANTNTCAGILARANAALTNYYSIECANSGNQITVAQVIGGTRTDLTGALTAPGGWTTLRFKVNSSGFQLLFDGNTTPLFQSSTVNVPASGGTNVNFTMYGLNDYRGRVASFEVDPNP